MTRYRLFSSLLAAGMVALFILAAFFAVIAPLAAWRADVLQQKAQMQTDMDNLTERIERLTQERDTIRIGGIDGLIWQANQMPEATAKVQSQVNTLARDAGILMRSIAPRNAASTRIPGAIGFRLEFEASLDQLVPFLRAVEFGEPALAASRVSLRRLARPTQSGSQPDLFVQMDIEAPVSIISGDRP